MAERLKLYGFNNLTKTLSFNIYDVCYAKEQREQQDYIAYIDEQYNSERLVNILCNVTEMIGAHVLSVSKQDYEPQGASATLLLAEDSMFQSRSGGTQQTRKMPQSEDVMAHLDKSHISVHTYPEYHPETSIATFRVDIDVATCGQITPLSTLDYLIGSFDSDIITMDYRVRGFTRDVDGKKLFMDHKMTSIQDYIDDEILEKYDAVDMNVYQANIFHTKMLIKEMDLQNYLFKTDAYELPPKERLAISNSLRREMIEIFSGSNIY
ncbi:MAG: adenosylmethionine decarboxylase [Lachnospiraceae bacterium]